MTLKITIIGLGQIGASIGLALAKQKSQVATTGYDQAAEVSRKAAKMGAVDKVVHNLSASVKGAEVVILALPINQVRETLESIVQDLSAGTVVMDTAPVKAAVAAWMEKLLPSQCHYVGLTPALNPLVLEETITGIDAARADLFQRGRVAVTASPGANDEAVNLAVSLVTLLGAQPYFTDLAEVDGMMAAIHLLPGLAAAALVETVTGQPAWTDIRKLAGIPFVAAMRPLDVDEPGVLTEAALQNRVNSVRVLDEYLAALKSLRDDIDQDDKKSVNKRLSRVWEERAQWRRTRAEGDWQSEELGRQEIPDFGDVLSRQFGGLGKRLSRRGKRPDAD